MKYLTLAIAVVVAAPVVAFAECPDPTRDGALYAASGPALLAPQSWDVRAAGTHVAPCDEWTQSGTVNGELAGFLPVAPTAVFDLDAMGPHILMVRAQATCRPLLAVRSGDGLWYFGQTANGRQEVTLWGTPNGPLQVWVGAAEREGCDAIVTLETFDR